MILKYIILSNEQEKRIIKFESIIYIIIDDYLSTFFMTNNQRFICSKSLYKIKISLPFYFFQINRSCIINLEKVVCIKRKTNHIVLIDGTEVRISFRKIRDFYAALNEFILTFTC